MHISAKCSVAVHCLIFLAEYGETKRVTSELLALSTGCNPVTVRSILSGLKKAGIVSVKAGTGGAALAKAPADIDLYAVTQAVEPDALDKLMGVHTSPSPFCPVGRNIRTTLEMPYEKVRGDLRESLRSVTLETVLAEYHKALAADVPPPEREEGVDQSR